MTTALQLRRGTTTQHSTFTGANGEVTVDTTKKTAVVHDGVTPGGVPLAKESDALNKVRYDIATQGLNETQQSNARTNINATKDPGTNGWIVRLAGGDTVARNLTAGAGISISNQDGATGNPVISNTGVRSVNGQTGDVTVSVNSSDRVAKTGDTMTGDLVVQGTGVAKLAATGDIIAYRAGGTTGVIYLNSAGNRYLYFDGSNYQMPGGELVVNGSVVVRAAAAGQAAWQDSGWRGTMTGTNNTRYPLQTTLGYEVFQSGAAIQVRPYGGYYTNCNCNCTCC